MIIQVVLQGKTTNIERIFMSNNYLLSKESLTEIEKTNNLQFIGNLLKMNRVIKEGEEVLQVDPSNAYTQISNVSSVFQSVFPVNQKYLTVADYKIAYKLKNSPGSDNKNEGRDNYEDIVEHINSGDRPVTVERVNYINLKMVVVIKAKNLTQMMEKMTKIYQE